MNAWLFSKRVDLAVFLGSALASIALLLLGWTLGILHEDAPPILWLLAVVLIDVAHVWSSAFVVYLDPLELKRRPILYLAVPLAGYAIAWALYSEGELVFWRALAYLAVFHFVRQQWGWVARYRRAAGETAGRAIDMCAIYAATLYPLWHWHLSGEKRFHWFMRGDFFSLPVSRTLDLAGLGVYVVAMACYVLRRGPRNIGKDIVVATTAVCWWLGIVTFDSDYAFTVTNVIIHGVPYFALVFQRTRPVRPGAWRPSLISFLCVLWLVAFVEEALWDKTIWQLDEHRAYFGQVWNVGAWRVALVPLLALPQIVHYVLDGFIWRRNTLPMIASKNGR